MIHVIVGPPCAGKSTYVQDHAKAGDVRIDFDSIARSLGADTPHGSTGAVRECAFVARQSAIDHAIEFNSEAWVIHTSPTDEQSAAYDACGAEVTIVDPGIDVCLARARLDDRPDGTEDIIKAWYQRRKGRAMHKTKDFAADIKAAGDDGGSIVAYASTFDRTPDCYGDVVAKGAFTDSLAAWKASGKPIPLLFNHDTNDPFHNIGAVTSAEEDDVGLKVTATLDPDNPTAQYVRSLVNQGRVSKMSFAYDIEQAGEVTLDNGQKANELQRLDLFEVSIVPIPANQNADIISSKSGRVVSKANEDALSQAIDLIQGVLDQLESSDQPDGKSRKASAQAQGAGTEDADELEELVKSMQAHLG